MTARVVNIGYRLLVTDRHDCGCVIFRTGELFFRRITDWRVRNFARPYRF
jgi:hypothetical protein